MASHEELVAELPKLEKMSNAARLKLARKRRQKQLKRNQDMTRRERETGQYVDRRKSPNKINFVSEALLHEAVCRNDLSEVESLLKQGVSPNPSNADGLTPLHRCCIENTVEMAKLLLEYGAERDTRDVEGWTPLHAASACGNLTMINLLVDKGASVVALNHDDKMPVDVACDGDIRYVIQQKMLEGGYTDDVCKFIRASIPNTMLADLKDAVRNGRSVNAQDKYGATALHVAAANGYIEVLSFLLDQSDIEINIQDNEGWTPFHAAVCWDQKEAMEMLAKKGANLEVQDIHGDTPFAVSDNADIRQYIIELKTEFTVPVHESLTLATMKARQDSMEDDATTSGTRRRSLSARRSSVQVKDDLKKESANLEKRIMNKSLDEDDMERRISGALPSSGSHTSPSPSPTHNHGGLEDSSVKVSVKETCLDEDGVLSDDNNDASNDKSKRRKELKSVLKNTGSTPVINVELEDELVSNSSASKRVSSVKSNNSRPKRRPPSNNGRECCNIL